jgi:hypothetical protein
LAIIEYSLPYKIRVLLVRPLIDNNEIRNVLYVLRSFVLYCFICFRIRISLDITRFFTLNYHQNRVINHLFYLSDSLCFMDYIRIIRGDAHGFDKKR